MAFTTAQDFIDVWSELDAAYVDLPRAVNNGDYSSTELTDTAGQFDATLAQFSGFADVLDATDVEKGDVGRAVNTAFVKLGNAYVDWLAAGNAPILEIAKARDADSPGQSYHDNLLGNLGDGPIQSRFLDAGLDDPRSSAAQDYGDRPYFSGGSNDKAFGQSIAWDIAHGIERADLNPSRDGADPLKGEVQLVTDNGVTEYDSVDAAVDAAGNGDTVVLGRGTFNGDVSIDTAGVTVIGANPSDAKASDRGVEDGSGESNIQGTIDVSAANVRIDGVRVEAGGNAVVNATNAATGFVLANSVVDHQGSGTAAVRISGDDSSALNNVVDRGGGDGDSDSGVAGLTFGVNNDDGVASATITGNRVNKSQIGVKTADQLADTSDGPAIEISGNEVDPAAPKEGSDAVWLTGPGFGAVPNGELGKIEIASNKIADGAGVQMNGTSQDDDLSGFQTDGNDLLIGRDGDDTLKGGAGDDTLQGGAGTDAAVIADAGGEPLDFSRYDFTGLNVDSNGVVSGTVVGPDGTETLSGVEALEVSNTGSATFLVNAGMSINAAIQSADAGDTIRVAPGTFNEQITVDKAVTIRGAGSGDTVLDAGGSGTGISVAADGVSIEGLTVQNGRHGLASDAGDLAERTIDDLSLTDVEATANASSGFKLRDDDAIDGLTVAESAFDANAYYGFNAGPKAAGLSNVQISNTSFNGNANKGFYAQTSVDTASFTGLTVANSGTVADAQNLPAGGTASNSANVGFEINTYGGASASEITVDDLTVTGSGRDVENSPQTAPPRGQAVAIIGPNQSGVTVKNSTIDAEGEVALGLGGSAGDGFTVTGNEITGPEGVTLFGEMTGVTVQDNAITTEDPGPTTDAGPRFAIGAFGPVADNVDQSGNTVTTNGDASVALSGDFKQLGVFGDQDNTLTGDQQDNILRGGIGDDVIEGKGGTDTAVIANAGGNPVDLTQYDFSNLSVDTGGGVSGTVSGPDGTETLSGIEVLEVANTGSSTFLVRDGMSVQAAVDAAEAGDTIRLGPGTFGAEDGSVDDDLVIDTPNLTIEGAFAGTSATANARSDHGVVNESGRDTGGDPRVVSSTSESELNQRLLVNAEGFTLDGVTVDVTGVFGPQGNAFLSGGDTAIDYASGTTLRNTRFIETTGGDTSVFNQGEIGTSSDQIAGLTLTDNLVESTESGGANFQVGGGADLTGTVSVTDNQLTDSGINVTVGKDSDAEITATGNTINVNGVPGSLFGEGFLAEPVPKAVLDQLAFTASDNTLDPADGDAPRGFWYAGSGQADSFTGLASQYGDRFLADAGDDDVAAGGGDDRLDGGEGDDTLDGGAGDDMLYGDFGFAAQATGSGDDRLIGGAGDDNYIGGAGTDTAVIADAGGDPVDLAQYDFSNLSVDSGGVVSGTVSGPDGTETLSGIEVLEVANTGSSTFLVRDGMSIQSAVDQASAGDTIKVAAGTYAEDLTVDKDVTLEGANLGIASDGSRSDESTIAGNIDVTASGASLDGFQIQGTFNGGGTTFLDVAAGNVTFQNNVVSIDSPKDSGGSSALFAGTNNTIAANSFEWRGPLTDRGDNFLFVGEGSDETTVADNTIVGGRFGANLASPDTVTMDGNVIDFVATGGSFGSGGAFPGDYIFTGGSNPFAGELRGVDTTKAGADGQSSLTHKVTGANNEWFFVSEDAADTFQSQNPNQRTVVSLNDPPSFGGDTQVQTFEDPAEILGTRPSISVNAPTDPDSGDSLTVTLAQVPGDVTLFTAASGGSEIQQGDTIALDQFDSGLFYELADDVNGDLGDVVLEVTDSGGLSDTKTISINATPRPDEPEFDLQGNATQTVTPQAGLFNALVGDAITQPEDPDAGDTVTYTVANVNAGDAAFLVDGDTVAAGDTLTKSELANLTVRNVPEPGAASTPNLSLTFGSSGTLAITVAAGAAVDDDVDGTAGADVLDTGAGADTLNGLAGDDVLIGGSGGDTLTGGAGSDTASYAGSSSGVDVRLQDNTASGGDAEGDTLSGIENLTGSAQDDVLAGSGGANTLDGGAGADLLRGLDGGDELIGGQGQDWASYAQSDAAVDVRLANDIARGGHASGDSLSGIEKLAGSAQADFLAGDSGANTLRGGPSGDVLFAGKGNDTASYAQSDAGVDVRLSSGQASGGHAEGDRLFGVENVTGSSHGDLLAGDSEANVLDGGGGNDLVFAGAGPDEVRGGAGDDFLRAGSGGDTIVGGAGTDTVSYAGSSGRVNVRLANDSARLGDATGDQLSGIENLTGSANADFLAGDFQDNTFDPGAGDDSIVTGDGQDTVVVQPGDGGTGVLDFAAGSDQLDLSGFGFADVGEVKAQAQMVDGDLQIDLGDNASVELVGFAKSDLDSGNVVL